MKSLTKFAASLVAISTVGCSAFLPPKQTLTVTVFPSDSKLLINGIKYETPAQVKVPRDTPVVLQCSHDGFDSQQHIVKTHINGCAILDGVGFVFFLFPGIGLLTPGAHSLNETIVNFDLNHPYVEPVQFQTKPISKNMAPIVK